MIKILNLKLVILLKFKKIKNAVLLTYVISDLKGKEIAGTFYKKELQKKKKKNRKEFSVEKLIKKKCDKLFIKWKEIDHSCNNWIDKNT